ncbi:MAG: prolipoprotein diacylglyceryl transferase [Robiginitomaculum sp.]|nr:prolipoprotein diacylglyceryl transferase [Robiginitomaculum sp.]
MDNVDVIRNGSTMIILSLLQTTQEAVHNCSPVPGFSPVIFHIFGPISLRWYSLGFLLGLILGAVYFHRLIKNNSLWGAKGKKGKSPIKTSTTEDMLFWATLGVIVGGRLGYVLLYDPAMVATPIQILKTWNGGMSFHGGMIGVSLAVIYVAWRKQIPLLRLADAIAPAAPIGVGLVRMANFINGELYGRPWDGPMAMSFPCDPSDGAITRHPSPLYEAILEGLVLFLILRVATHYFRSLAKPGLTAGIFLTGYGVFRTLVENVREPDAELIFGFTRGMVYSAPMWMIGLAFIAFALNQANKNKNA